jgi:hypothetical protein
MRSCALTATLSARCFLAQPLDTDIVLSAWKQKFRAARSLQGSGPEEAATRLVEVEIRLPKPPAPNGSRRHPPR